MMVFVVLRNLILLLFVVMNKVVENYTLLEIVGSGQYGNVYKAQHKTQPGFFAVKVMSSEKFEQQPKLSEFTNNEIQILSKIDHPNIIKFKEILKTTKKLFLVYEFCEGGTLSDVIKKNGPLPQEDALSLFDQMRNAFVALFKANILHRDIKPSNILFKEGVLKLADFGFCKELQQDNDLTQTMVGSPIYMAPEVLKGQPYDSRADIWSLGVILYEMLFKQCPYEENSIPKLISLIDSHYLSFPDKPIVSEQTKAFIKKLLTLDFHYRIDPYEFINIKLPRGGQKTVNMTYPEAGKYMRRALIYLTQTLQILSQNIEHIEYLRVAFLIYKIISSIQEDTIIGSIFWQNIGINIKSELWEDIIRKEAGLSKPYGDITREALRKYDTGLKTKVQLQTKYIDSRYYLDSVRKIDNNDVRLRLLNCFLYNKHFILVKEKRATTWEDPASDGRTYKEKEQICHNYAKYY